MNTINKTVFPGASSKQTATSRKMRLSKTTIIVTIILSIVVFFFGMMSYSSFFSWILPEVDGVIYLDDSLTKGLKMSLVYSLTLAAIPFATVLLWRTAGIQSVTNRIIVPIVLIVCIATITALKQFSITNEIREYREITRSGKGGNNEDIESAVSLSYLGIEKYMVVGLLVGMVVVYFSMRQEVPKKGSFAKPGELE